MEIVDKIKALQENSKELQNAIDALIDAHIEQINKVIEDKIMSLKEELRQGAIDEVCGAEYKVLADDIAKNEKFIKMLQEIAEQEDFMNVLKEIVPKEIPVADEIPQPNEFGINGTSTESTSIMGTNEDNLTGNLS